MAGWTPNAVHRLIALIAGIVFFGVGVVLMILGISAPGSVDFHSSLFSGGLKTGSAGLLIAFMSTFIIVFAMVGGTGNGVQGADGQPQGAKEEGVKGAFFISTTSARLFWVFIVVTLTSGVATWLTANVTNVRFNGFLVAVTWVTGIPAIFLFLTLLVNLFEGFDFGGRR